MLALVHAELVEGLVLVDDAVLLERLVHVEHAAIVLPGIRGRVRVVHEVALEDLVHCLLGAYLRTVHKQYTFQVNSFRTAVDAKNRKLQVIISRKPRSRAPEA